MKFSINSIYLLFFHKFRGKAQPVGSTILIENGPHNDLVKTLPIRTDIPKVCEKLNYFESIRIN